MKKKKIPFVVIVIMAFPALFAVAYFIFLFVVTDSNSGYYDVINSGRSDLYHVARYSVLAVNDGNYGKTSIGYDVGIASDGIRILEEDDYGRIMYIYRLSSGKVYQKGVGETRALLICQKSDDDTVWFYEDFCFFLGTSENEFVDAVRESLKDLNDWGEPLNEDKMFELEYDGFNVDKSMFNDSVDKKIFLNSKYWDPNKTYDWNKLRFHCITDDSYGRRLLYFCKRETYEWYFMIVNPDDTFNEETYIEKINDVYAYQQQLHDFKQKNGWNTPYEGKAP